MLRGRQTWPVVSNSIDRLRERAMALTSDPAQPTQFIFAAGVSLRMFEGNPESGQIQPSLSKDGHGRCEMLIASSQSSDSIS